MSRSGSFARRAAPDPARVTPMAGPPAGRRRGRSGWWDPVPYHSTRTRRGTEVSAGGCGCCLPIPLLTALGTATGLRALARRLR